MKRQTLGVARRHQDAEEYVEVMQNLLLTVMLMCLIKRLGHTAEEITAAEKLVTESDLTEMLTGIVDDPLKPHVSTLISDYFKIVKFSVPEELLKLLSLEKEEANGTL